MIRSIFRAFILLIFFTAAEAPLLAFSFAAEKNKDQKINCDIQNQPCTQAFFGQQVTLDITPKPVKALENLTFHVKVTGQPLFQLPFIDLGMPGMEMGPNRVELKPAGPNTYTGQGIIVRCPSDHTIWKATVSIPEKGVLNFIFDVIY